MDEDKYNLLLLRIHPLQIIIPWLFRPVWEVIVAAIPSSSAF